MLTGVVKWFNDAKGFGFIEHTSGKDVFVHYSVIEWEGFKTLKDGEKVLYELKEGEKGLHAAIVRRPNVEDQVAEGSEATSEEAQSLSSQIEVIKPDEGVIENSPFSKSEENQEDTDFQEQ